jgi:DNA-binding MarR family transcriptional regulator
MSAAEPRDGNDAHVDSLADESGQTEAPSRTPAGDAFSLLAILVIRLNGLITAAGDALARPARQTSARWQVLASVEDQPMTVADIARTLGLTRQSVQRVADLLEADGLVREEGNPRHRRASLVTLTPSGRTALRTIQVAQAEWANDLGAELGARELARANVVLERVLETLMRQRPGGPA